MAFVSINNGFYNTKAVYQRKQILFRSAIRKPTFDYDTNTVIVNSTEYIVGEGEHDIELDKTWNITQIACIKEVLRRFKLNDIDVITSLPINSYLNKQARSEYKNMVESIKGINKCSVFMEGLSATFADYEWYRNKLVCLLDIGGLTINTMLIDNCNLVPNTAFSMQLGTIILENSIRKALEQNSICNVPSYQIKYMKDNKIISSILEDYIHAIKQELKKHQYPTDVLIRFIGGGAIEHEEILKKEFKTSYTSKYALYENVLGLDVIGGILNEKNIIS